MESNSINNIRKMIDNLKFKSPIRYILNKDSFNYNFVQTNIISSGKNNINNNPNTSLIKKILLERLFEIIKNRIIQTKIVFERIKNFLYNNKNNIRNDYFLLELKKEIFLDKIRTNKLKEEYYNKCNTINKKGINSNFRNKLFKKLDYKSKTHNILLNNFININNQQNFNSTNNNKNIKYENKEIKLNDTNNFNNLFMKRTAPNFYHNHNKTCKSKIYEKRRSFFNLSTIYTKRINLQKFKKKEDKKIFSSSSNKIYGSEAYGEIFTPEYKNNKTNRIIKNYNNINNIFLSENLDDYQAETYNPKNNYNLYTNYYLKNNKININTDRIYKKNSLSITQKAYNSNNSLNELKDKQFKEFIINYNYKGQISFDGLKKNLKKEFSNQNIRNNKLFIIKENHENKLNKLMKNKTNNNNKYIKYNNIININDAQIIHKDINLQNDESTSNIQTYLISFNKNNNTTKNTNKNIYREDIVYHRPKSSSKFRNTNKTINFENNYKKYFSEYNFVEFNGIYN